MHKTLQIAADHDCAPYIPYIQIWMKCETEDIGNGELSRVRSIGDPCIIKAVVDPKFVNENTEKEILDYVKLKYTKAIYGCNLKVEIITRN